MVTKVKDMFWHPVTIYVGALVSVFSAIWLFSTVTGYIGCNSYGNMTGRVTKYSIVSGCYVKTEAGMIPQSELNKRVVANGVE